ncbi:NUDIX domain-containing protein [Frondihabitans peucedani]|uniref:NUDIX domain-containing protein n=1 Tax=Frondihabitans peucedani TaxID=598626 RepID=A0ABP8E0R8_9MICO
MAVPDFVLALRSRIGTDPLWLSGVTACVVDDGRVLLVKRADNGRWTPVTGIIDPGENPATAAAREVLEEADVVATPTRLAMVDVTDLVVYENGDQTRYLDLTFLCDYVSGDPFPADGENTEARWFPLDGLPEMTPDMLARLNAALADEPAARFEL